MKPNIYVHGGVLTYDEASMCCLFLEHQGVRGWRLPTILEMYAIINCRAVPDLDLIGGWWWCLRERYHENYPNMYLINGDLEFDTNDKRLHFVAVKNI